MHVAVAHQDELRVDSLGKECFGEGFVEFRHGRGTLRWTPADGTFAAVARIGIRHLPRAALGKRYIRLARRRRGASSLFLPHEIPLLALPRYRKSAVWEVMAAHWMDAHVRNPYYLATCLASLGVAVSSLIHTTPTLKPFAYSAAVKSGCRPAGRLLVPSIRDT